MVILKVGYERKNLKHTFFRVECTLVLMITVVSHGRLLLLCMPFAAHSMATGHQGATSFLFSDFLIFQNLF
jgi:hypothetical protein